MLDLTKKFQLKEEIVLRKIDSKCWALNVENGNQYRLNEVSYLILDSFRDASTVEEMIAIVKKEYAVDKERLIADCSLMIQTAVDKNILKEV
ncbi:MAG TPA: PqqD family protein [Candidatus Blautia stercorigallinarum]|uniref:PqqD family protein n=1 Tax=Candidatus Blautia stercorigallinarum TaxID=2838501 RepID=A0A9D1PEF4_9FIRM|nr:PqqD family protein [Ruminococcus sp.]HIV39724.1 PqqD family protein [Candidatus Blautia stercorigallinarum]